MISSSSSSCIPFSSTLADTRAMKFQKCVNLDAGMEKGSSFSDATCLHHDGLTQGGNQTTELSSDPAQNVPGIPKMVLSSKRVHDYFEHTPNCGISRRLQGRENPQNRKCSDFFREFV